MFFGNDMYFIVIVGALLLNMIVGRLFSPFPGFIVNAHISAANSFSKYRYRTSRFWGAVITIILFVIIWAAVQLALLFLQAQSVIYAYIIYGLSVFAFVQCGQLCGKVRKLKGELENEVYVREIFSSLLARDAKLLDRQNIKKIFSATVTKIVAERIITSALLLLILGPGASAAYIFLNTLANSDDSERIKSHGFADFAIKLNNIISYPGYLILSLVFWCIKWVTGLKYEKKTEKIKLRPAAQLSEFSSSRELEDDFIGRTEILIYASTVLFALIVAACYVFIEAAFAAIGLDEYWNFWNGKNIGKNT